MWQDMARGRGAQGSFFQIFSRDGPRVQDGPDIGFPLVSVDLSGKIATVMGGCFRFIFGLFSHLPTSPHRHPFRPEVPSGPGWPAPSRGAEFGGGNARWWDLPGAREAVRGRPPGPGGRTPGGRRPQKARVGQEGGHKENAAGRAPRRSHSSRECRSGQAFMFPA